MMKKGFMELNFPAPRDEQPVMVLDGIVYYPHYKKPQVWCGPGTSKETENSFSTKEMLLRGAKQEQRYLWERSWTK